MIFDFIISSLNTGGKINSPSGLLSTPVQHLPIESKISSAPAASEHLSNTIILPSFCAYIWDAKLLLKGSRRPKHSKYGSGRPRPSPPIPSAWLKTDYISKASHQVLFPYLATSSFWGWLWSPCYQSIEAQQSKAPFGSSNYHSQLKWTHSFLGYRVFSCTFINCHLLMGYICLLSSQRQSFVPLQGTYPSSFPLVPFLFFILSLLSFISYPLLSVPLGQINLFCAQNLVVGVPSQYFPFMVNVDKIDPLLADFSTPNQL